MNLPREAWQEIPQDPTGYDTQDAYIIMTE